MSIWEPLTTGHGATGTHSLNPSNVGKRVSLVALVRRLLARSCTKRVGALHVAFERIVGKRGADELVTSQERGSILG